MGGRRDRGESSEPMVRVPRPRSQVVANGMAGLVMTSVGLAALWFLLKDETLTLKNRSGVERTATRADRWPIVLPFAGLAILGLAVPIIAARTSPLTIRRDGLKYDRKDGRNFIPWDQVRSCHWNPYRPGVLDLNGPNGRVFIKVPRPYCDQVEAALRQVGKWSG